MEYQEDTRIKIPRKSNASTTEAPSHDISY